MPMDPSTPVLLLGGQENTISVAESLARNRIDVAVTGDAHCWGLYSKHAGSVYPVPEGESLDDFWNRLLLSPGDPGLAGRVILAMNDAAIEFVLMVQAMQAGRLPPTVNLVEPDPDLPLRHIIGGPVEAKVDAAISNSFAFGGLNAVLAVRAVD